MEIRGCDLVAFGLSVIVSALGVLAPVAELEAESRSARQHVARLQVAPPPDWVLQHDLAPADEATPTEGGVRYLLMDTQDRPASEEHFRRLAMQMVNEQGVQASGTLTFPFHPSYQKLLIHFVRLHRGKEVIDQLDESAIKIIQPEDQLDADIYTGEHVATLFLNDLRVGDVLEFAHTIRGRNPALRGHYTRRVYVEYPRAVQLQTIRTVVPSTMELRERYFKLKFQPEVIATGSERDYRWTIPAMPAVVPEDYLPLNFEPFAYIELSDFASWREVAAWALPMYPAGPAQLTGEMESLLARWQTELTTADERALAALRHVQEQVRYLSIDLGQGSYTPAKPVDTLTRRFGDCKDKAYLLCVLLERMGIEARPALVSMVERERITDRLPSPSAFDHVIVRLTIDDQDFWVDPTLDHQGGTIRTGVLPDYGVALVIEERQREGLDSVSRFLVTKPQMITRETFTVEKDNAPVHLRVETEHLNHEAEAVRATLAMAEREELGKSYLNFYSRQFGEIRSLSPPEFIDDVVANRLTIVEEYEIKNLWVLDPKTEQYAADVFPHSLQSVLTDPATRLRTMPLYIPYPLYRAHRVAFLFPEKLPGETETQTVSHEAFVLMSKRAVNGSRLAIEYELRTLQKEVRPTQVESYLARLKETEDVGGCSVFKPDGSGVAGAGGVNWGMVAMVLVASLCVGVGGFWLCTAPRFRAPVDEPAPVAVDPDLQGLRGWLVLVGISVVLGPFIRLFWLLESGIASFSQATWHEFATPSGANYHPWMGPLIRTEMVGNLALLGLSLIACYLFFAKRRLFPTVYIVLLIASTIFISVDEILGAQIPSVAAEDDPDAPTAPTTIVRAVISCLIWVPYMLKSKRVKSTFLG